MPIIRKWILKVLAKIIILDPSRRGITECQTQDFYIMTWLQSALFIVVSNLGWTEWLLLYLLVTFVPHYRCAVLVNGSSQPTHRASLMGSSTGMPVHTVSVVIVVKRTSLTSNSSSKMAASSVARAVDTCTIPHPKMHFHVTQGRHIVID